MTKPVKASVKKHMPPAIKNRMQELGLKVTDLAKRADVPATTLYAILGGSSEPGLSVAVKLSWALGWSLDYFVLQFFSEHPLAEITKSRKMNSAEGDKACA